MSAQPEHGAAAVELSLLLTVSLVVLALVYPLGTAFAEKLRLGRAAGDAARFASATPDTPSWGATGRRPSEAEVLTEARRAYLAAGGSSAGFAATAVTATRPGAAVSVTLSKTVDLGPLGAFLDRLGAIASPAITVSARASGREE